MLVVCVIAASLAAAWIVYWFLDRPALERKVQRHEQELRGLRRMAMVDELTGLRNRRALEDLALPEAVRFVRESGKPVGLGFMDFDNFKAANRLGTTPATNSSFALQIVFASRSRSTASRTNASVGTGAMSSFSCSRAQTSNAQTRSFATCSPTLS